MILSIFELSFSKRRYNYELSKNDERLNYNLIKNFFYLEIEKSTHLAIAVINNEIKIYTKKKRFTFGINEEYIVKGVINCNGKVVFNYSIRQKMQSLKHAAICLTPTLIMFYIFSFYDLKYSLIAICYYLLADLILFFKNSIKNKRDKNNFEILLRNVEKEINLFKG